MTNLLLKLFVRNYEDPRNPAVRNAVGALSGAVGIGCNVLLFLGKLLVGTLAGSVSITADALNNLSDATGSIVTLAGFKLAGKPADEGHPYGHARFEYLSGLAVAALVVVIGFDTTLDYAKMTADQMVVTDLDGTLLQNDQTLSVETVRILNELLDQGLCFTYATGRSFNSAAPITKLLHLTIPVITRDGCIIADPRDSREIEINRISDDMIQKLRPILAPIMSSCFITTYAKGSELKLYCKSNCIESCTLTLDNFAACLADFLNDCVLVNFTVVLFSAVLLH